MRRRRNPITTFNNEQSLWLAGASLFVAGTLGYLLYAAGKSAQQIADLQASLPASTPAAADGP
jgi:hypothetical protein